MDEADKALVHECLEEIRSDIGRNILDKGLNASGATIRSMEIVDEADGATLYGRAYFSALETGRKPGKMPPSSRIYRWTFDKRLAFRDERERKSFAYLTARKIGREGTQTYRDGGRTDIFTEVIERRVSEFEARLVALYRVRAADINGDFGRKVEL